MNCPRGKNISLFLMFTFFDTLKHFQKIKYFNHAIKTKVETLTQLTLFLEIIIIFTIEMF